MGPVRWTLNQFFFAATFVVTLVVGGLFFAFLASSRASILASAERARGAAATRIEARVADSLAEASGTLESIDRDIRHGVMATDDPTAIEARLLSAMGSAPHVADITLTRAEAIGDEGAGDARTLVFAPTRRWQLSLTREASGDGGAIRTRLVTEEGGAYVAKERGRGPDGLLLSGPLERRGGATDPTEHPTFRTSVLAKVHGEAIWSDLSWFQADMELPPAMRQIVLTQQKAIKDGAGKFVGVLRVAHFTSAIDEVAKFKVDDGDPHDPHRVFLCDASGQLITRLAPGDPIEVRGEDLRAAPKDPPPAIAAALASPLLHTVDVDEPDVNGALDVHGERWLMTLHKIPARLDWIVGIVVPESHYTRDLEVLRDRFLASYLGVTLFVLLVGGFVLARARGAFGRLAGAIGRMRGFDFAPLETRAPFREVAEVMDGVERAKTAMRALGKYVPIDLVRELYASNREPTLGGTSRELSMLFTDIRGFTTLAEGMPPEVLAPALGRYLAAMTEGIHSTGGTVDKFIGDGVMAFWNAPTLTFDHARRACEAVLACLEATEKLFASPEWLRTLPPLFTRFGLHVDTVLVGHFGAPERLSYTAMGDGVNLASRLEALGKQYGVATLASEAIVERAGEAFVFRLVDRVAVKGKTKGVRVYELLGRAGFAGEKLAVARAYERALEAYFARDFARARALLAPLLADGPSATLDERCAYLEAHPPSAGWDGVFVAKSK